MSTSVKMTFYLVSPLYFCNCWIINHTVTKRFFYKYFHLGIFRSVKLDRVGRLKNVFSYKNSVNNVCVQRIIDTSRRATGLFPFVFCVSSGQL